MKFLCLLTAVGSLFPVVVDDDEGSGTCSGVSIVTGAGSRLAGGADSVPESAGPLAGGADSKPGSAGLPPAFLDFVSFCFLAMSNRISFPWLPPSSHGEDWNCSVKLKPQS